MAVAQTGAIFKALTVDGESSRNYGVYITGQAVYNAPQREVEMISIAGRNGKFALDKGRFENIEVTYPAGIYADTEEDFAEAVSNFRNYLCSRDGYVRIEDEYNPNEYRMGVYKSGLEVTPKLLKAGEFDITFDCKPQRWLKSGENAITVASGDVVTNPTLFESSPMLEVNGTGNIELGGEAITITGEPLGEVVLSMSRSAQTITFTTSVISNLNDGDSIYDKTSEEPYIQVDLWNSDSTAKYSVVETVNGGVVISKKNTSLYTMKLFINDFNFVKGTSSSATASARFQITYSGGSIIATITLTIAYDGENTVTLAYSTANVPSAITILHETYKQPRYYGNSTKMVAPSPMYIDLDIGEAYGRASGEIVSYNDSVRLPSDLPKLSSGANTITFDDTITRLKIVPRWWKV